ncbi:MAG: hypothetical protein KAW12_00905 [Candidatus Aminicenantes bacterium]|nr:hypothetical protein [Candidatus Aminicenantes bacterium]
MQVIREVREVESEEIVIRVPKEYRKKRVEVIILPLLDEKPGKEFSKEIEDFLSLGGSGCWEGDLDEMRRSRDGIG